MLAIDLIQDFHHGLLGLVTCATWAAGPLYASVVTGSRRCSGLPVRGTDARPRAPPRLCDRHGAGL